MDYVNHSDISGSDLEALLFRSDILAQHEYWKVHRPDRFRQPELELMLAVLEDALHCYFANVQMRTRREKKIFNETEEWFFSKDSEGVFTFENICSLLGIDPDYIRRGIKLFKDAHRNPNSSDKPKNAIAA
jgi:hypothetical protein